MASYNSREKPSTHAGSRDEIFLKRVIEVVEENLKNEQFGVENLAEEMNLSRIQIYRKLQHLEGKSISQFIREIRLKKAIEFLKKDVATASEIAYRVGFGSPSYFNKCFREHYGVSPGEVKKRELHNATLNRNKEPESTGDRLPVKEKSSPPSRKKESLGKVILILMVIILGGIAAYIYYYNSVVPKTVSMAVLPFEDLSAEQDQQYLGEGVAVEIINHLSSVSSLSISSQTSSFTYMDSAMTVQQIGEELGVQYVLEGSVIKENERLKISAHLTGIGNGLKVWSESYDRTFEDIFRIQTDIIENVIAKLKIPVKEHESAKLQNYPTDNPLAYDFYLKGIYQQFRWAATESLGKGMYYFHKAIELDSSFADPYFEIAEYMATGVPKYDPIRGEFVKLEAELHFEAIYWYLEKALHYDPDNTGIYGVMAIMHAYDFNFKKAEEYWKKIYEIKLKNLESKGTDNGYPWIKYIKGNIKEAVRLQKQLMVSYSDNPSYKFRYYRYRSHLEGDYLKDWIKFLKERTLAQPQNTEPEERLGLAYLRLGDYSKAIEHFSNSLKKFGWEERDRWRGRVEAELAISYLKDGQTEKADSIINEIRTDWESRGKDLEVEGLLAICYAHKDEIDEAFRFLYRALEKKEEVLFGIKVNPLWDPLRKDPRFNEIVQAMGL